MTGLYANAVIVASLVLLVWSLVYVAINRPPDLPLLGGIAVLEVMLVGLLVGGVWQMAHDDHDFARLEFVGYLLAIVAIPPVAVRWVRGEKSRAAAGVLAVVFLTIPVLVLRVQQVWSPSA